MTTEKMHPIGSVAVRDTDRGGTWHIGTHIPGQLSAQ